MMFKEGVVLIVELAIIHVINSQSVVVTVQDATVTLGEDASIHCSYTISGGTFLGWSWAKSTSNGDIGAVLITSSTTPAPDSRYSVDTSQTDIITLIISKTVKSDEDFYSCSVILTNFVTNNDFGRLTVQYLDEVFIDISSTTAAENVVITCSAEGFPLPMINLTRNDSVIQRENASSLSYTINSVTVDDGGSYKCTATNSIDSKQSGTIVLNYFKPAVDLDKEEVTVPPGSEVTIKASVSANPDDITYKWTIDNLEIVGTDRSSTLTFMVPESAKNGTEYTAIVNVTNSIGSTKASTKITVNNPCTGEPCENSGTCNIVNEGYNCSCTDDFFGFNCEICIYEVGCDFDKGDNLTIYENGTCGCTCGESRYICDTSDHCENFCASNPCQNGGTCIPAKCNVTCKCKPGNSGQFCEFHKPTTIMPSTTTKIVSTTLDCECENGGTCDGVICICPSGFSGPTCEDADTGDNVLVIIFGSLGGTAFVIVISGSGYKVYIIKKKPKTPKDPPSDPVCPQDDVEMKQTDDLKRYPAGGALYTQVNLKDKKKKLDSDKESNKPTAVDLNVEGLQYADLDLTRNLPTDKKDVIHHREPETMYSSIQNQKI